MLESRFGFNKDGDGLKTIKYLLLYSAKDCQPIAFAKQPGNIPDVISLENALKQLHCFALDAPLVTTDTGYYSESNIAELFKRRFKFLTRIDAKLTRTKKIIDLCRGNLDKMDAVCPFDSHVTGTFKMESQTFSWTRKRKRGEKTAGEKESLERRVYFYVFKSVDLQQMQELKFREELYELKQQAESGVELTDAAQKKVDTYLTYTNKGRCGETKVGYTEEACAEKRK